MSSGSSKKNVLPLPKRTRTAKAAIASGSVKEEPSSPPASIFRQPPKAKGLLKIVDASAGMQDPKPRAIKAERRDEETVIISSDEGEKTQHDFKQMGRLSSKNKEVPGDKTIRTRSSNGIKMKRVLEDAAIFSDEDNVLLKDSPPKKTRYNPTRIVLDHSNDNCKDGSDQPSADIIGLSAPFKLKKSHVVDEHEGEDGLFVDDDDSLESPIIKSNMKGRNRAESASQASEDEQGDQEDQSNLHPAEAAALAKAVEASRQDMIVEQNLSQFTSGSSTSHVQPVLSSANADPVIGSSSGPAPRKTFREFLSQPQTTPMMSSGPTLYYEDTMKYRVDQLPSQCEVDKPELRDELLSEQYKNLPPLKFGTLKSWSTSASGLSLVRFSQWPIQCPEMDYYNAVNALGFVRYNHFINPSRISPLDVNILYTSRDYKRSTLQCNFKTAICLSAILSEESLLISASTSGLLNKYISGHFHQFEWQRFEAFCCMVFNKLSMIAQINNQSISFGTMGPSKSDRATFSSPSKYSGNIPRNPGILVSSSSGSPGRNSTAFRSALNYTDDVPIYDARDHPFNFTSDLDDLSSVLPRFRDEIPPYSFVVVGYTLSHYEKDARPHLATNIQFAILFGCE